MVKTPTGHQFSVREKPWMGLGTKIDKAVDSEQALILAGQNWGVVKKELVARDGSECKPPHGVQPVGLYRMDTNVALGIATAEYQPIQNREAFNLCDTLIGEGCRYEAGGDLWSGRYVWMAVCLPERLKVAGDDVDTYLLLSNRHDGKGSMQLAITPIRLRCQNVLNLAMRKAVRSFRIRHSGDIAAKFVECRRVLGLTREYVTELASMADLLSSMKLADSDFDALVEKLMPVADHASERTENNIKTERAVLAQCLKAPDLVDHRGTAWAAVNAVADYVDHKPLQNRATAPMERFYKVVNGHEMLDKALALLLP